MLDIVPERENKARYSKRRKATKGLSTSGRLHPFVSLFVAVAIHVGKFSLRSFQVCQQVSHLLNINLFVQIARHGRKLGNVHFLNIFSKNHIFLPFLMPETNGSGSLRADQP